MTKLQLLKRYLTRIIIIAIIGVMLAGAASYFSGDFAANEDITSCVPALLNLSRNLISMKLPSTPTHHYLKR
jgi:hypothetical protein